MILILFSMQVSASTIIDIDIKEQFSVGEVISFDFIITSDKTEKIGYIVGILCPNAPLPSLEVKTTTLKGDIPFKNKYEDLRVWEEIVSQTCNASISIIEPYELIKKESFKIITDPSFSFDIKLNKKVYLQKEDINLDYTSDVENPDITAVLIYPDKTTEQVNLPTTISSSKIGTYELEVTASKQGYKTITKTIQFGVIEKQAEIKTIPEPDLSEFSIRGDAREKEKTKAPLSLGWIILLILGLITIILIIIYIIKFRKK